MKTIARKLSQVHLRLLGLAAVLLIAAPPRAGAQQAIGGLRIERTGHTATRLPGGKILVVGGENRSGSVRDSEVFDPSSRIFSAATGLLTARADHTATLLPDGRLFVIGGRASSKLLDSTEFYDPETGVFSAGPALNHARAGHTATLLLDGRIAVIGGDADGSVETLDPAVGVFRLIEARLAVARKFHAAVLLQSGDVLIAGGVASGDAVLNSAELLDTGDLIFLPMSLSMHVARSRPTLRMLPDGKVQAIGGDPDSTMELFNTEGRYFSSLAHPAANPDLLSAALKTQTRAAVLGRPGPKKLLAFANTDLSAAADETLDRTGYSLTEIPELHQALATGGTKTSGQLKTTAALFASSAATVTTDKTDYAPGETVIITGTGWQPGETVNLNIHRDTGDPPDTPLTAVADASGNISNSEYVVQEYDLGITFLLTATGQTSGFTAQTSFTDGNVRVRSNAAGITFDLDFQVFSAAGCTGTITDSGTDSDVGNTSGTQFNKGVGNTQSIRLTAEAFSNQGGDFRGWTASDTTGTEVDPDIPTTTDGPNSTNRIICVPGFSGNGNRLYIAHYVAGNSPPIVTKDNASVTVNEGQAAGNTGTFADNTNVTFTASVGTVTKTPSGTSSSGTWSWSFATTDGPAQSQTVTITATDTLGASTVTTFPLTVNNVAPTATLGNNGPINEGGSATVSFTAPSDPSSADTSAGFHYAYSCTNGDLSGSTYAGSGTATSTSCSFNDNGSFPVKGRIIDKDDGFSEYTTTVVVNNVAPTASFTGPSAVNEGAPATYSFSGQSDPSSADTAAGFHYAYDCNGGSLAGATYVGSGTSASTSCTFPDGPASVTVRGRIIDKDNGFTEYTVSPVVVANVPPSVTAAANQSGNEGASTSFSLGSFTDPGADSPWAVDVDWGDLSSHTTFNVTTAGSLGSQNHTYADNGTYTVTVKVTDKDTAFDAKAFTVTVANVAPTATMANNGPINEGGSATVSFSGQSDPSSTDTTAGFHYAYSCTNGDLSGATYASTLGSTASTSCSFNDNGSYPVKGRIIDKDDGFTEYTTTVVVNNVAPTAVLSNNGPVDEGSPATISFSAQFDPSSSDTSAGFHYAYSCANGDLSGATYAGSGTSPSTGCTFPDNGSYIVKARILDKDNGFTEYTTTVPVNNVAPTLTAPADQTGLEGTPGTFSVGSFTDPGADSPWAVVVTWGDSTADTTFNATSTGTLTGQNHTYADNGTYTVTVKVTDKDGAESNVVTFQITVSNAPPTATLSNNGPVNEGSPATITFSDQADTSPADTAAGFHYAYSCTNGDLSLATYASTAGSTASTSCTFNDNGSYTVKARIIDKDDGFTEYTTVVTVNNVAPTAVLSNNGPVNEGSPATISFSGQFDPSSADTTAGFHYAYACDNGDLSGATYALAGTSASKICTFVDNGTYTVKARIIDKDDGFTQYTTVVTVNNVAPSVTAPAGQSSNEGENKSFSLGSFSDPGTADNPWTVNVNWGDTHSDSFTTSSQGAISHSHTYDDNGTYTVTYTVTDKDGGASSPATTFQVTVANVAPTATLSNNGPINEGGSATVTFSAPSDPSNADTAAGFHYAYSCTNGDLSGATYAASGTSTSTSCTFNDNGTRTVKARIIDKDGGFTEYTTDVTVNNVAPTAVLSNNGPVNEGSPATISFSSQFDPSSDDTAAGFHYAYDCNGGSLSGATYAGSGISATTTCTFADNGSHTVSGRIIDKDGGGTEYSTTVVVTNVAPSVTAPTNQSSNEGENKSFSLGSFTDPGTADNPWTVSVNWGDLTPPETFLVSSQGAISHSHTYDDNGTYTVTYTVTDKDGGVSSPATTFQVTVANVAPTATLSNNGPVDEGSPATVSFSGQFDPSSADTTAGFHYAFSCANGDLSGASYATSGMSASTSCTFADNGSHTVKARIIDKNDGYTEYTTAVMVNNANPAVGSVTVAPEPSNEGSPASASASFTDSGAGDTHTCFINWGDGNTTPGTVTESSGNGSCSGSHIYADNGSFTVTITITDDDLGTASASRVHVVNNVGPTVGAPVVTPSTINENDTATLTGSFSDPGILDGHTVMISWGDGSANTTLTLAPGVTTYSAMHQYRDDNPTATASDVNPITVTVTDKDSASASNGTTITVNNVVPVVTSVTGPLGPLALGSPVTMTATFTDVGTLDTHKCSFNWDETPPQITNNVSATETNGSGSCSASHTYAQPGVYSVVVTVTDDDTGSGSRPFDLSFVVIYDPSAGFVTGGGWINQPPDGFPALTGKASFGFVSKYKKGSFVPEGETEFQFQAGNINFHSSAYDAGSLVISGGRKATYRGDGTVNGQSGYRFLLIAYDGDQPGGDGIDRFRIKITQGGTVIYDNRYGKSEDLDLGDPTALGGGSIVIHK